MISAHVLASWYELSDWQQEILGMLNLLVRGYQSYGSIMGQVIELLQKAGQNSDNFTGWW